MGGSLCWISRTDETGKCSLYKSKSFMRCARDLGEKMTMVGSVVTVNRNEASST